MTSLEVIRRATVEIVEKADPELQRSASVSRLGRPDHEFVDILLDLVKVESDDSKVASVVQLQEIEAERFLVELRRGPDGQSFEYQAIIDSAGVLQPNPVNLEGHEALCACSAFKFRPPCVGRAELP